MSRIDIGDGHAYLICLFEDVSPERLCVSVEWNAVKECGTWVWVDVTALGSVKYGLAVRSQTGSGCGYGEAQE